MVNPNVKLATMFIVLALGTIGTTATAFAQPEEPGIETADEKVHENTGAGSEQDLRFHEGLCQGGITTEALEDLGGCDVLTAPGNSDEVRQDN
jgi:hypothetical protein